MSDPALLADYEALLSAAERAEVAAAAPDVAREALLSRAMLRATLARYCGATCRRANITIYLT